MFRSHPLYLLACITIAIGFQWALSHRLRRAERDVPHNPQATQTEENE